MASRDNHVIFLNLKWNPKTWTMTHEQIVAMAMMNQTHQAIGMALDVSAGLVTQVLNSEKGRKYKAELLSTARKAIIDTIPDRIDRIVDSSVSIVEEVMITRREEMMSSSPRMALAMMDRATSILKGAGKLIDENDKPKNVTNVIVSNHTQNQLIAGLDKLNEAWSKHGIPEGVKEITNGIPSAG